MGRKVKKVFVGILRWLLKEWAKAILSAVSVIFLGFLIWVFRSYIKDWLISIHSLEMYGGVWIVTFFAIVSLTVLVFWLVGRKPRNQKLKHKISNSDVKTILTDWLMKLPTPFERQELVVFSKLDKKLDLPKDSSKKYLKGIILKHGKWKIERDSDNTMLLVYYPPAPQVL